MAAAFFWTAWIGGALGWLLARHRVAGLTLFGAWCWLGAFWVAFGVTEASIYAASGADGEPAWAGALRFVAGVGVFCPLMSVLGAKRPQDQAWHFIVLSLWGVLAMPAAEVLILHPGQELDVHDARAWFLAILIAMSTLHLLMTRFWIAGLLFGAGQVALLGRYCPFLSSLPWWSVSTWTSVWSAIFFSTAIAVAWLPRSSSAPASRWDRLWHDFRDLYGVLWALRIAGRVNESAELNGWPLELSWQGFVLKSTGQPTQPMTEPPKEHSAALESCVRSLLRRFVSPQWIADRLEVDLGTAPQVDLETPAL